MEETQRLRESSTPQTERHMRWEEGRLCVARVLESESGGTCRLVFWALNLFCR